MDVVAKGQMAVGRALDIEALRVGKVLLVKVGGMQPGDDRLVGPNLIAAQVRFGCSPALRSESRSRARQMSTSSGSVKGMEWS